MLLLSAPAHWAGVWHMHTHRLACRPVAALDSFCTAVAQLQWNSLDRSLRRLCCVKGFYLSDWKKFLWRDGLRSPCDRFSCISKSIYKRMKETTLVVGVAQSTWKKADFVWRFWPCSHGCSRFPKSKLATWLILPVVICLSQRLSHACLSTSQSKVKPRMAH